MGSEESPPLRSRIVHADGRSTDVSFPLTSLPQLQGSIAQFQQQLDDILLPRANLRLKKLYRTRKK